ncbi:MAG: diguanylate cyclase [Bacillota bacterium]
MEDHKRDSHLYAYMDEVARVTASILASPDRDDVLAGLARAVVSVFGVEHAGVFLWEDGTDTLVMVAQAGAHAQITPLGFTQPAAKGMIGRAARTGQLQLANDVTRNPDYVVYFKDATRSEMCIPLIASERVIGVLDIQSRKLDAFSPDMLPPLKTLAHLSALAVEQARLHQESHTSRQVLSALLDATDSAIIMVDTASAIRAVNQRFCQLFRLERPELVGRDLVKALGALRHRFASGEAFDEELRFLAAGSGDLRWSELETVDPPGQYRVFTGPVKDAAGALMGRIQAYQDITALRHTQSRLELIARAGKAINQNLCPASILERLAAILAPSFGLEWMGLIASSEHGLPAEQVASWSWGTLAPPDWLTPLPDGDERWRELVVLDLRAEPVEASYRALAQAGFGAVARIPLLLEGRLVGLWYVAASTVTALGGPGLRVLESLADPLAGALKNARLYQKAEDMYQATIRALAATIDARDRSTMDHSVNVSRYAGMMARTMNLPAEEVRKIEHAGLVHDIGKVGIPDRILNKPGRLDMAERAVMISHSAAGASILERCGSLRELAPLVRHHHEWHAGGGYPSGLAGDDIPLGAAILAVADAFDTMTSYRVYRTALGVDQALEELRRCAGGQFHPQVVEALSQVVEQARASQESWLAELESGGKVPVGQEGRALTLVEQGLPTIMPRELRVLLRIAEELNRLLYLPDCLQHVLYIVSEEMGFRDVSMLLLDPLTGEMTLAASTGAYAGDVGLRLPEGTGIAWWVMQRGLPQNIPDVNLDPRHYREKARHRGSELYVPLETRGRRLGVLVVGRAEAHAFSDSDLRLLVAVGTHVASAIEVAQIHEQVKRAASTDPLTDLYNRRHFMKRLEEELARARRHDRELALVIADLDHLKWINDTYGHLAGDEALTQVAKHLRETMRVADVVARFGGDEFVILMPETSAGGAHRSMERLTAGWLGRTIETSTFGQVPVPSLSYGVACYPEDGEEPKELIARADERLFRNKHSRPR